MCMENYSTQTDAQLVERSLAGESAAFAAIYDRYADRLHSYCFVMLRDPHSAADATQDTFVRAATKLSQLRDPAKLRPWLFSIARNEANAEGRKRAKTQPVDDLSEELVSDRDPSYGLAQEELKELVWSAVAGLQDRDRDLMTLHLVEGLDGDDLAEAMGVKTSHLHVMLSRMRDRVEKALGALLIARRGQDDCAELASLLDGWDGRFDLDVRSKVTRHVESCDVCTENRALLASPAALLPSVIFIPAPEALRDKVLTKATASLASPATTSTGVTTAVKAAIATIAAVVALLVGGVIWSAANETEPPVGEPVTLTSSTTMGSTTSTNPEDAPDVNAPPAPGDAPSPEDPSEEAPPTTVPGPSDLTVSQSSIDFGSTRASVAILLTNEGDQPTSWSASIGSGPYAVGDVGGTLEPGDSTTINISMDRSGWAEGDYADTLAIVGDDDDESVQISGSVEIAPVFLRPQARPDTVFIPNTRVCGPSTTTISVIVQDDAAIDEVYVRWDPAGGNGVRTELVYQGNNVYSAQIGPFVAPGDVSPTITATDSRGNSSTTDVALIAVQCP